MRKTNKIKNNSFGEQGAVLGINAKDESIFFKILLLSICIHIAAILFITYSPFSNTKKIRLPHSINVNLKTLKLPEPEPQKEEKIKNIKKSSLNEALPKNKSNFKEKNKNSSKFPVKYKTKFSLKKKTFTKSALKNKSEKSDKQKKETKVVDKNNGKNKKAELTPEEKLKNSMAKIQNNINNSEKNFKNKLFDQLNNSVNKDKDAREAEINLKSKNRLKIYNRIVERYKFEISSSVEKNWAFNPQLVKNESDLETLIAFKVMQNGTIDEIWFDEKSENSYFNESAYNAIVKTNPVKRHPKTITESYIIIGLKFTPSGIK